MNARCVVLYAAHAVAPPASYSGVNPRYEGWTTTLTGQTVYTLEGKYRFKSRRAAFRWLRHHAEVVAATMVASGRVVWHGEW